MTRVHAFQWDDDHESPGPASLALLKAAHAGDARALMRALRDGADPMALDRHEHSALMAASEKGHADCVGAILESCHLEAGDIERAAGMACRFDKVECLRLLIDAGANVDGGPETELSCAMRAAGMNSIDCLRLLAESGADLRRGSRVHGSPLTAAARYGADECAEFLIQTGADLEAANAEGETAAMTAAFFGKLGCLRLVLRAGARVDAARPDGATALARALASGSEECVGLLIGAGADIELRDPQGRTPLLAAIQSPAGRPTLETLLGAGADLEARCHDGLDAKEAAILHGRVELAQRLGELMEARALSRELRASLGPSERSAAKRSQPL